MISGPVVMSGLYLNHALNDSYIIIIDYGLFLNSGDVCIDTRLYSVVLDLHVFLYTFIQGWMLYPKHDYLSHVQFLLGQYMFLNYSFFFFFFFL